MPPQNKDPVCTHASPSQLHVLTTTTTTVNAQKLILEVGEKRPIDHSSEPTGALDEVQAPKKIKAEGLGKPLSPDAGHKPSVTLDGVKYVEIGGNVSLINDNFAKISFAIKKLVERVDEMQNNELKFYQLLQRQVDNQHKCEVAVASLNSQVSTLKEWNSKKTTLESDEQKSDNIAKNDMEKFKSIFLRSVEFTGSSEHMITRSAVVDHIRLNPDLNVTPTAQTLLAQFHSKPETVENLVKLIFPKVRYGKCTVRTGTQFFCFIGMRIK